jgi:predicted AAA+ superfamily ATPase
LTELKVPPEAVQTVTFEDRKLLAQFEADPISFTRSYLPRKGSETLTLMIDEFQYAEQGGQKLKLIYDTMRGIKIILTGSSSLNLKAETTRYLVGRLLTFYLAPFHFGEFLRARDLRLQGIYQDNHERLRRILNHKKVSLPQGRDVFSADLLRAYESYCLWGGYPAVVLSETDEERKKVINEIYSNYILRDIKGLLELATERNLYLLSQILATQIGNISVYHHLGQASGLDYRQLKRHLNILTETFITFEVKPFFRNRQKELSKSPKIYSRDLGFRNNLMENMSPFQKRSDTGAIVENAALIGLTQMYPRWEKINFWRTKVGAEVDFVLTSQGQPVPVEIKFSSFGKETLSKSLTSFIESFQPEYGIVFTRDFWGRTKKGKTSLSFVPLYYL